MEFKYDIGFIVPKYGEIVGRKKLLIGNADYEVKLNYSDPKSETISIFTEKAIDEYVEKYKDESKVYEKSILIFNEVDISIILHNIGTIIEKDLGNLDVIKYTNLLNKIRVNYKDKEIQDWINYLLKELAKHKDFSEITF